MLSALLSARQAASCAATVGDLASGSWWADQGARIPPIPHGGGRGGGVRGGAGGAKPRRSGNVCNGPLQRTTGYFLQMDGAGADEIWVIILYLSLWSFNS